jgi:hypothetical protein
MLQGCSNAASAPGPWADTVACAAAPAAGAAQLVGAVRLWLTGEAAAGRKQSTSAGDGAVAGGGGGGGARGADALPSGAGGAACTQRAPGGGARPRQGGMRVGHRLWRRRAGPAAARRDQLLAAIAPVHRLAARVHARHQPAGGGCGRASERAAAAVTAHLVSMSCSRGIAAALAPAPCGNAATRDGPRSQPRKLRRGAPTAISGAGEDEIRSSGAGEGEGARPRLRRGGQRGQARPGSPRCWVATRSRRRQTSSRTLPCCRHPARTLPARATAPVATRDPPPPRSATYW